ncbi:hypothetical protein QTP70_013674 [Hemibagrus guttatus]|uniref:Uncharacterized protein n=1 Tax=Hemibagrus guttatus TaxID=175788 RepID=A0AAE0V3D8_9TELE|nr:hypothetical protein QTP70_013674 [Hemibagrus guttatus]
MTSPKSESLSLWEPLLSVQPQSMSLYLLDLMPVHHRTPNTHKFTQSEKAGEIATIPLTKGHDGSGVDPVNAAQDGGM